MSNFKRLLIILGLTFFITGIAEAIPNLPPPACPSFENTIYGWDTKLYGNWEVMYLFYNPEQPWKYVWVETTTTNEQDALDIAKKVIIEERPISGRTAELINNGTTWECADYGADYGFISGAANITVIGANMSNNQKAS